MVNGIEMWTHDLAQVVAETDFDDLTDEVVDKAALCALDWLGLCIRGAEESSAQTLRRTVCDGPGASGPSTVVGSSLRTNELTAAMVNAYQAHAIDFDDTHPTSLVHTTAPILSAVVSAAEARGASGADVVAGYVVGVEVAARIGRIVGRFIAHNGFHVTGVVGTLGAAAGVANLLGLDARRVEDALGVAATQAAGLECSFGTMSKPLNAGKAAMNGLLAALLAERGFTGPAQVLERTDGFLTSFVGPLDSALTSAPEDQKGSEGIQEVLKTGFKPYPSCLLTHGAIDAAKRVRAQLDPELDKVDRIDCRVSPLAVKIVDKPYPDSALGRKFSIQHCIALSLSSGEVRDQDFVEVSSPRNGHLDALLPVIEVSADDQLTEAQAVLTVSMADGRVFNESVSAPKGTPANPMTRADVEAKFVDITAQWLDDPESSRRQAALCLRLPSLSSIQELMNHVGQSQ